MCCQLRVLALSSCVITLLQVVQLVCEEILPYAHLVPRDFIVKVMNLLNRGSIHSASSAAFVGKSTGTGAILCPVSQNKR